MEKLIHQADKFELPDDIHYLNGSFMSPQLKSVTKVGLASVQGKIHPYKMAIDDFFDGPEKIRREYSKLINNNDISCVCIYIYQLQLRTYFLACNMLFL